MKFYSRFHTLVFSVHPSSLPGLHLSGTASPPLSFAMAALARRFWTAFLVCFTTMASVLWPMIARMFRSGEVEAPGRRQTSQVEAVGLDNALQVDAPGAAAERQRPNRFFEERAKLEAELAKLSGTVPVVGDANRREPRHRCRKNWRRLA